MKPKRSNHAWQATAAGRRRRNLFCIILSLRMEQDSWLTRAFFLGCAAFILSLDVPNFGDFANGHTIYYALQLPLVPVSAG